MLQYHFRNVHLVSIVIAAAIIVAVLTLTFQRTLENEDGINNSYRLINPKDLANHTMKNVIDINALYTIPTIIPKKTIITGQEIPRSSLGSATIDVYKDVLLPVNMSQYTVNNQLMCPATFSKKHYCKIDSDSPKSFSHSGGHWHDLNTTLFRDALCKIGPIMFVGDSLNGQMANALKCALQIKPDYSFLHIGASRIFVPFSNRLKEYISKRFDMEKQYYIKSSTDWADVAIAKNVSYIVYNTGAWWNPSKFRWKSDWCHWSTWERPTNDEMIKLYEIALRESLAPVIRRLKQDHGITTIWRDVAPAGVYNETSPDAVVNKFSDYWHMFPVFSEIGRKVVIESGGLVLPIWDVSFPHWRYHRLHKNDHLHWCEAFTGNSVPMMWVKLLYNMLYDHLLAAVESLDATPSREWRDFYKTEMVPYNFKRVEMLTDSLLSDHNNTTSVSNTTECHCEKATGFAECYGNQQCVWNKKEEKCRDSDLLSTLGYLY